MSAADRPIRIVGISESNAKEGGISVQDLHGRLGVERKIIPARNGDKGRATGETQKHSNPERKIKMKQELLGGNVDVSPR